MWTQRWRIWRQSGSPGIKSRQELSRTPARTKWTPMATTQELETVALGGRFGYSRRTASHCMMKHVYSLDWRASSVSEFSCERGLIHYVDRSIEWLYYSFFYPFTTRSHVLYWIQYIISRSNEMKDSNLWVLALFTSDATFVRICYAMILRT